MRGRAANAGSCPGSYPLASEQASLEEWIVGISTFRPAIEGSRFRLIQSESTEQPLGKVRIGDEMASVGDRISPAAHDGCFSTDAIEPAIRHVHAGPSLPHSREQRDELRRGWRIAR